MGKRIAVVGAGPLGLMALKTFKEDGFDVTCFESRAWVGGLWVYSNDSSLSTAENTVFNSSKYRLAISDFPVDDSDMDDFPTAPQLHRYFEAYCTKFDLWPHLQLSSQIKNLQRVGDQWTLHIESNEGSVRMENFDKVAMCCGPFVKPRQPTLKGHNLFTGRQLHAMDFHDPEQFKGKNVLLIGLHASAQDVVCGLSEHAAQVYVSHRSGVLMMPRYTDDGSVYDRIGGINFLVVTLYLSAFFPTLLNWLIDTLLGSVSKKAFPNVPQSWGFSPAPSVCVAPLLIASEIYPHLASGFAEPVPEVSHFSDSRTVHLKSGRVLANIDAVIYCTGYDSIIPVEMGKHNPYAYPGALPDLYRNMFPLHEDSAVRNSLAYLGQAALGLPAFSLYETFAMSISQIWLGNSFLPPLQEMQAWHKRYIEWRKWMTKTYDAKSTFYTAFVPMADHLVWVDETAGLGIREHFGLVGRWINWSAWKFWWEDPKFYALCGSGLMSPAIWRLFEKGKRKGWQAAKEQIRIDNKRVEMGRLRRLDDSRVTEKS